MQQKTFLIFISLILLALIVIFGFSSRKNNNNQNNAPLDIAIEAPDEQDEQIETNQEKEISLKIEDLIVGSGKEAQKESTIVAHYTGTLQDGAKFDSSYDRGRALKFTLGVGQVIKGWDIGLEGMKIGGKRKLTIPPELAYGEQGIPGAIPPNAVLIFEIDLIDVLPPPNSNP